MAKTLILLSLKPQHWPFILDEQKTYEYRTSFRKDAVQAYMYLSSPQMEIAGFVDFGKPIIRPSHELAKLAESQVSGSGQRVMDMLDKRKKSQGFAIPIISYESFKPISLRALREHINVNFQPPQQYLVLDNHPKLRDFIRAWHLDGTTR